MTYIIKVWNRARLKKVLKGFDGNKPVFVSEHEWRNGATVQECGTYESAQYWLDKLNRYEHWRSSAIVQLH